MKFEFRNLRLLRLLLGLGAVATGSGSAVLLVLGFRAGSSPTVAAGIVILIPFAWELALVFRLPSSEVRVDPHQTRIKLAGIVDVRVPNREIRSARVVDHSLWRGLGARVFPGGLVILTAVTGAVVELELSRPVRLWLRPLPVPLRARTLRLGVEEPARFVGQLESILRR